MPSRLTPGRFFGTEQRRREVGGFSLVECAFPPGLRLPSHSHETAFFYFVLDGASTENTRGADRDAATGTLVFHPAGETHANHWLDTGGRCLHLELSPAAGERREEIAALLDRPFEARGGPTAWLAARLYREFRGADPASGLAIEGLILELLAMAARSRSLPAEPQPPRWLSQAREMLHERFSDPLSLDEIAAAVGVHPSHLARVFRQQHQCTVGEYVRRLRLEFACHHLTSSDTPLAELALAAGFADQSHFSKTFRHAIGVPPGEFRRRSRPCKRETTD
jgi:AraC family transcriptional regulator